MMTDEEITQKKIRGQKLVITLVRLYGVIFILAGTACLVNLGGLASAIGLTDAMTRKLVGGALLAIGILDYLVIPPLLAKKIFKT